MTDPVTVKLTESEYYKIVALYTRVQLQQAEFQRQLNDTMALRDACYNELRLKYPTLPEAPAQLGLNDGMLEITAVLPVT